jgi:ribonucleoside-diphosphate reductase alpha chain
MDNVIDMMDYPDPRFKDTAQKYRQIGLGMMGLADAMFKLNYRYDGPEGKKFAAEVMRTITTASVDKSADLAELKGAFFEFEDVKEDMLDILKGQINNRKVLKKVRANGVRNSQFTTCQPTGTTALSCDCSYGVEPIFGLVFEKKLVDGDTMKIANPIFLDRVKNEEWWSDGIIDKIFENGGSLKGIHGIPREVREVFITAHDIKPKDRVDMQSHIQKHCSTAISSTVNLTKETTAQEIADLYKYAWKKSLKGLTIYRDGSKRNQPVTFRKEKNTAEEIIKSIADLKIQRPKKLSGETHTVETGNGKMYVTVNSTQRKPIEVFIEVGKAGQSMKVMSEALGRIVSIALQHRVPIEEVIKTLRGLDSSSPAWYRFEEDDSRPVQILSIPDGLAQLLERYYINTSKNDIDFLNGSSLSTCKKCGVRAYLETEGCGVCQNCGFSHCS